MCMHYHVWVSGKSGSSSEVGAFDNIFWAATYRSICGAPHIERYGNDPQGYRDKIESEMQMASTGRRA